MASQMHARNGSKPFRKRGGYTARLHHFLPDPKKILAQPDRSRQPERLPYNPGVFDGFTDSLRHDGIVGQAPRLPWLALLESATPMGVAGLGLRDVSNTAKAFRSTLLEAATLSTCVVENYDDAWYKRR